MNTQQPIVREGVVAMLLIVIVISVALGIAIIDTPQSKADARHIDAETAYQTELNDLDIKKREADYVREQAIEDAKTAAEIAGIEAQYQRTLRKADLQNLILQQIAAVGIPALAVAIVVIAIGISSGLATYIVRSKPATPPAASPTTQQASRPQPRITYLPADLKQERSSGVPRTKQPVPTETGDEEPATHHTSDTWRRSL